MSSDIYIHEKRWLREKITLHVLSITKHLRVLFSTGVARSSGKKYNQRNECPQQCGPRPHPLSHEEKECDKEREIEENEAVGHPTDLR